MTDPRSLVTRYGNNWLDLPEKITSPDTGVTDKTYDAAGNVKTSKDARGQTTSYLYDELNRRVKATHADGSVITFVYDQGANGKGRLTSLIDPTGTTSWTYDGFGHVLQKKQVTGAVTLTTSWSYDAATGRLTGMTYPSGHKVTYSYDAGGRVSAIGLQPPGGTAAALIDQIGYSPFGPVVSWRQAASNKFYRRSFDRDGRISGITSSTGNVLSYAFDAGSRITRITESGRADKTFSYDRNNRLTRYVDGASTIAYAYDASGNRISDDDFSYAIASTSNRIASRTPIGSSTAQTLFYDAAGGMENNGLFQLRYDERNRLDRVTVGALTTTYGVNGLGERVAKDGQQAFGKVEFVYGLSGGLLGQYNASGAAAEEIIWLGDLPIATIQGGAAYNIAPDHLGAPHQIVNSANAQVWFWNHDPFGNGAPTAAAGFAHRLRFPGQIYDAESGLHSNGHRDYDPRLGRYVESDPIGLEGGINTYAYAGNDPVNAIDPLGLDPKRAADEPGLTSPCLECLFIPLLRLPRGVVFAYESFQSYRALSRIEATGQFYSVGYEMKLSSTSYPGVSRGTHFQEANKSLLQAMEGDAAFAQDMESLGVKLQRTPTGLAPRTSPSGWTWHHAKEPGVMQLVPRSQHQPGSIFQDALHPNSQGGYSIWGK